MAKKKKKISTKAAVREAQKASCQSIADVLLDFEKTAVHAYEQSCKLMSTCDGMFKTIKAGRCLFESMAQHVDVKPKRKAARK